MTAVMMTHQPGCRGIHSEAELSLVNFGVKRMAGINKVVLAYSGGLDTSVIAKWLQQTYDCEVVTFTADIGQGEEVEPARAKAEAMGIKEIYIEDLKEDFVRDYVYPMFRANALYEGEYLLGTSIARPLIAKRLVEIAAETGADAISHGATGKGNDQVRFELGAYALSPGIQVIAPWREWDLNSRDKLLAYCAEHNISVEKKRGSKSPYSMDANLLHISYEGDVLEDREMRKQRVGLEHQPHLAAGRRDAGDVLAVQPDGPRPGREQPGDGPHGGGLAAARRAQQRDQLALADGEVQAVHRHRAAIGEGQVLERQELRHTWRTPGISRPRRRWRPT